jgi:hypothetical protein
MIEIRVSSDISGAMELVAAMPGRVGAGVQSVVEAVASSARETAPVRTGALRDSIVSRMTGPLAGEVTYGAPHARYLFEGTGVYGPRGAAFTVLPREKKALFWPGAAHPVARVLIQGIRPRDFVTPAVEGADIEGAFVEGCGL